MRHNTDKDQGEDKPLPLLRRHNIEHHTPTSARILYRQDAQRLPRFDQRGKIDPQKVLASLNTPSPKCGHLITPAEIKRVSWDEIERPQCGERVNASKPNKS